MKNQRTILNLRTSAVIETVLIILGVLLLSFVVGSDNRFFDVNPHPLWLAVLFVAVQYGTAEGIMAAILCSLALLIGNMPERTISMKGYEYALYVLKNPLLWLTVGLLVGELRQRHIRERDALKNRVGEIQVQADTIADNYERVRNAKDRLETRVAGQLRSSLQAYQAAKEIEKLHPSDVLHGIQEIVTSILAPEKFSVWLLSNNGMDTTLTLGWGEQEQAYSHLGSDSELYQHVIGRQEVLHVANSDYERVLAGQGVLAGPLFARETGEIIGMLKIEKLGFTDLNLGTIETFRTICEWVALAFVNARRYQEAKADTVYNPDHNLMTYGYFQRYTDYITALAKRVRFDVNMVVVRLANPDALPAAERANVARSLGTAVSDVLRAVDLAFDYQKNGEEYSIMLPATNRPGADVVVDKLKRAVAARMPENVRGTDFVYSVQSVHQVS